MGRPLRIFEKNQPYFITQRTFQGRFLMAPSTEVFQAISGILAKATHLFEEIRLYDAVCLSNHFHLILDATGPSMIPRFMAWLNREISVRVGKMIGWPGAFWHRRYDMAPILDDESFENRQRYIRQHGVKEGLVYHHKFWPGLSLMPELMGKKRVFTFRNKTLQCVERLSIKTHVPPHHRAHPYRYRKLVEAMANEESKVARNGRPKESFLGVRKVKRTTPTRQPADFEPSDRIVCFARTKQQHKGYQEKYNEFVRALRERYDNLLEVWRKLGALEFCLPGFALLES